MKELTLPSGSVAKINMANFSTSMKMKNEMLLAASKAGFDVGELDFKNMNLNQEISGDILNSLINAVLAIDSSDKVQEVIFECMKRCTYDQEKITRQTFENEGARQDYYTLVAEVIRINLAPFFKGLVSALKQGAFKLG